MHEPTRTVFSFTEPDHLIRIHVRMELEDVGFIVAEDGLDLSIEDGGFPTDRCGGTAALPVAFGVDG